MTAAALAEQVIPAQSVVAAATYVVWVVELTYLQDDVQRSTIVVDRAPLSARPQTEELLPAGAELLRAESMPVCRLRDLPVDRRHNYRRHYRAFLMWNRAQDNGMRSDDMVPHVDYDPIAIDEDLQRWVRPLNRYCGD
jgi:hypothetical protein